MAGRTSDISTSSFKPLSLDEIMMVPLAKQQAEDNASLALDELSLLESNALDADKEYVSGQIGALKKEAGSMSDQLMQTGVDRNLINKVKGLRNRKNNEFSLEGKIGQASAAYNQFQANKKAITARKDLTAAQKQAGLARAQKNYTGVSEGGQYEDYVGTSHIDVMAKGKEIMKMMTPQQVAGSLGISYDPSTQLYSDGTYTAKKLSNEQIQKVVYQGLKNDMNVNAYLTEIGDLGIADPETVLQQAAVNAGNVGQVDDRSEKYNLLPQYLQNVGSKVVDTTKAPIDRTQPWSTIVVGNAAAAYNRTLGIDGTFAEEVGFSPEVLGPVFDKDGNQIPGKTEVVSGGMIMGDKANAFSGEKMTEPSWSPSVGLIDSQESYEYKQWKKKDGKRFDMQEKIGELRANDPQAYDGKNDKYVYDNYVKGMQKAGVSYSTVTRPTNPKNTYFAYTDEQVLGLPNSPGDMFSGTRGLKVMGPLGDLGIMNPAVMAEHFGYDNVAEMSKAWTSGNGDLLQRASVLGVVPSDPDMPYGNVIQVQHKNGEFETIVVEGDPSNVEDRPQAKIMMSNLRQGKPFSVRKDFHENPETNRMEPHFEYFRTKVSPYTGKYESSMIRSKTEFTENQINNMKFGPDGAAFVGDETFSDVEESTYADVIQRGTNAIADFYDYAPGGITSVKQGQDANVTKQNR